MSYNKIYLLFFVRATLQFYLGSLGGQITFPPLASRQERLPDLLERSSGMASGC